MPATISQIVALEKPLSASVTGFMVPVIMASASPSSATDGVGSGCRISPRIVPTKIASMCMPRASTPSGGSIRKIARAKGHGRPGGSRTRGCADSIPRDVAVQTYRSGRIANNRQLHSMQ